MSFAVPGPPQHPHLSATLLSGFASTTLAAQQQQQTANHKAAFPHRRQRALQAEAYVMAAADHAAEWKVPPSEDGWVLSHDALRLDLQDMQRLLDSLSSQAAAGRPLQPWQLKAALHAWRYHEHMLRVHHQTEEELYFPLLRTRFEVPQKQSADHEGILKLMQACSAGFDAAAQAFDTAAAAKAVESLRQQFGQFRRLCEAHYREEEVETLPLIRRHFTPDEIRPTAKKISKAYGLLDMGNYLRPMTPEQRTAWMTRVGMPWAVQWLMALQVWRYQRAVVQSVEKAVQQAAHLG